MKESSDRIRRAVLWSASGALTSALIVAGSAAQAAHVQRTDPAKQATQAGPGYPAPKGIYKPFTDCPIVNPLMQESLPNQVTGCVTGEVIAGKIKIGNITTKAAKGYGQGQDSGSRAVRALGSAERRRQPQVHRRGPAAARRTGEPVISFPQHIPGGLNGEPAPAPEHQQDRSEAVQRDPSSAKNRPLYAGRIRWSDHQLPGCHLDPADHVPPDQPVARPELLRRLG